jgi:hypothetical protein
VTVTAIANLFNDCIPFVLFRKFADIPSEVFDVQAGTGITLSLNGE